MHDDMPKDNTINGYISIWHRSGNWRFLLYPGDCVAQVVDEDLVVGCAKSSRLVQRRFTVRLFTAGLFRFSCEISAAVHPRFWQYKTLLNFLPERQFKEHYGTA